MIEDILIGIAILLVIALILIAGFSVGYIFGQISVSKEYYEKCDQEELMKLRKMTEEDKCKNKSNN